MFKFLKDKLKGAISKISEGVEKEGKIEEKIVETSQAPEVKEEKKGFFAKIKETFSAKKEEKPNEIVVEKKREEEAPKKEAKIVEEKPKVVEHKKEEKTFEVKKPEIKKTEEKIREETPKAKAIKQESKIPDVKTKKKQKKHNEEKEEIKKTEEPKKIEISKPVEEKKGFFETLKEKIITTKIDNAQFEKLFWDMELALMENSVAVEVIEKIKND